MACLVPSGRMIPKVNAVGSRSMLVAPERDFPAVKISNAATRVGWAKLTTSVALRGVLPFSMRSYHLVS